MMNSIAIRKAYADGENITQLLRREYSAQTNTPEIIEIAYDMQAGSYVSAMQNAEHRAIVEKSCDEIIQVLQQLGTVESIAEAGIGEATTFSFIARAFPTTTRKYGFDLSWSRLWNAASWLKNNKIEDTNLSTGNLLEIPYADNSFDIVYTNHTIEPNGGNEVAILKELHRITNRYLVLVEPSRDFASAAGKARMDEHGYCRDLPGTAKNLGYKVVDYSAKKINNNPLNPAAFTIIEKNAQAPTAQPHYECPRFHDQITHLNENFMGSKDALAIYPIVKGIPCLRRENSIIASQYCST